MSLQVDLHLVKPFSLSGHEAVLSIYYTASCLKKRVDQTLDAVGLTDVQFNLMMLLKYQTSGEQGLSQTQISEMMLVNRANITTLVDRMEKAGVVRRRGSAVDRRCKVIGLTEHGTRLLEKIEPLYAGEVLRIMDVLDEMAQMRLIEALECVRKNISPRPTGKDGGSAFR